MGDACNDLPRWLVTGKKRELAKSSSETSSRLAGLIGPESQINTWNVNKLTDEGETDRMNDDVSSPGYSA
jgi:hypothetical protein